MSNVLPFGYSAGTTSLSEDLVGNAHQNLIGQVESHYPESWPLTVKTFRTQRDAGDWARRTEDDMVRGAFIQRSAGDRMTVAVAMKRYLSDVGAVEAAHNSGGRPKAL